MKGKAIAGWALLAASIAAFFAWKWWQQKQAATGSGASPTPGIPSSAQIQQVGSNIQNISVDVIKAALDFAAEQVKASGPCWVRTDVVKNDGCRIWVLRQDGRDIDNTCLINGTEPNDLHPKCA